MQLPQRLLVSLALMLGMLLPAARSHAAGLFLAPRGVRPLARAGAFVAGAEGMDALPYNPAGLAEGRSAFLLDAGIPLFRTEYTRRVTPGDPALPTVTGRGLAVPSPSLGASHDLTWAPFRVGLGLFADYPALQNWPDQAGGGQVAPQRYAIKNYRGTAVSKAMLGVAYDVGGWLSIGASYNLFFGTFAATTTVSACDGVMCTQPENPDYDSEIQMVAQNIAVSGAQVGAIVKPTRWLRLGVAWETGYTVEQEADLRVRLPSAAAYADAQIAPSNPQGNIRFRLPMALRSGVELRFADFARVEAAFVWEPWSVHEAIDIDTSSVTIEDVLALGDYSLAPTTIPRGFRDTYSVRLGSAWSLPIGAPSPLRLRLGGAYEPSAVPDATLTAMAVDLDKIIASIGLEYTLGRVALEATYARVFGFSRTVTTSRVLQVNPTRPGWQARTPVGNGTYDATGDVFGVGLRVALPTQSPGLRARASGR